MDLARSFNLNDPDFVRDPYPVLAQLRSHGKPLWHEEMQLWLAATHADASAVLRSKTLVVKSDSPDYYCFISELGGSILGASPPRRVSIQPYVGSLFKSFIS